MARDNYLFSKYDLRSVIANQEKIMFGEIDGLPEGQLLGTAPDQLAKYFVEKCELELPILHEDQISVDTVESTRDVSQDHGRLIPNRRQPFHVPATDFKFFLPFEGDGDLFRCRGNQISFNPPRADIEANTLVFTFNRTDGNAEAAKADFTRQLDQIKSLLPSIVGPGEEFNRGLEAKVLGRINARRDRLSTTTSAAAALGYPLRRRPGAPNTYTVPSVKRKLPPTMPEASGRGTLEPMLAVEAYEDILSIMSNMVTVMEQSPAAFRDMDEEHLRQHFLVQLNGQYAGRATGETFNFEGKTDILIRENAKNIFIAECKFWTGPKGFSQAIDQLLGYTTWRDTKTALIIFNRGRALSTVIGKIPELLVARPEFVRDVPQDEMTRFRCVLRRPDDPDRKLILTVMVFEVPGDQK